MKFGVFYTNDRLFASLEPEKLINNTIDKDLQQYGVQFTYNFAKITKHKDQIKEDNKSIEFNDD